MAMFLAGLRGVDGEILKAAQIDGASVYQTYRNSDHSPRILFRIDGPGKDVQGELDLTPGIREQPGHSRRFGRISAVSAPASTAEVAAARCLAQGFTSG